MMFDRTHTLYIFGSLLVTLLLLYGAHRAFKREHTKLRFLRFFALSTVLLHISPMWLTYLESSNNYGFVYDNVLFPIHFCNLAMYCLLVAAYLKPKTMVHQTFMSFTAWAGIFGGLISLFYPVYYLGQPSIFEWMVLKSMLSHSTLLIGSLYLILGGFVEINRWNLRDFSIGLIGVLFVGLFNNALLGYYGKNINSMFLKEPPIQGVLWLNFLTMPLMMLIIMFGVIVIKEKRLATSTEAVIV